MNINKEIQLTAKRFKVPESKLQELSRGEALKAKKFLIRYICNDSTKDISLQKLGRSLGYNDHCTVMFHRRNFRYNGEYVEFCKYMARENPEYHKEKIKVAEEIDITERVNKALDDQMEFIRERLGQFKGKVINETLIDKIIG